MPRAVPMRIDAGWDPRMSRMVGVSAGLHVALLVLVLFVLPRLVPAPLPIVAYTVELTDPSALGGALPPGRPDKPLGPRPGAPSAAAAPAPSGPAPAPQEAKAPEQAPEAPPPAPQPPPEAAKPPEPPRPEETVKLREPEKPPPPKPEPKKAEVKPEPKPEPKKAEAKPEPKPEPKPATPAKPSEAAKPAPAKPKEAASTPPAAAPKAASAKPAEAKAPSDASPGESDGYAAAAEKWRARGATGGGGGLSGTDTSGGPVGSGASGPGGGGQMVGVEFLAYQQRVVSTVKAAWVNAITRPGLVAKVRFHISSEGEVSDVHLEQASGNAAYDASAARAVERANPLPPPPARYANEFREFVIEFRSEEEGGQIPG